MLQDLMVEIMKSIKFQESQKTKAKASLATSIALGVFGVVGGVLTCNVTSAIYGISSVANVYLHALMEPIFICQMK